ncbi:MAG TPA: hypothetical protein PK727_01250 [Bacteroidales bacterium]|jgi:hypothetical protein|nr:hypothetical protein [Bacteroidales bacterium]
MNISLIANMNISSDYENHKNNISPFIKKCEFGIQMNTDAVMLKYGTIFV